MFDYHDRAYSFRVTHRESGQRERYGLITLQGTWQLAPASRADFESSGQVEHVR